MQRVYVKPASLFQRAVAYVADALILLAAWLVMQTIFGFEIEQHPQTITLVNIFSSIAYFTYFHSQHGATPGKKLMEIRVLSVNNKLPSILQAFVRYSPYAVLEAMQLFVHIDEDARNLPPEGQFMMLVYLLWYGVSVLLVINRKDRRTLHDLLAYTQVLHISQQPPAHK